MSLNHYVTLGRSGLRVSPLCLGTMTFGEDLGWGSSVEVSEAILAYDRFLFFDTIHIGGGNAKHLDPQRLSRRARIVSNSAGILGGVRIWELDA